MITELDEFNEFKDAIKADNKSFLTELIKSNSNLVNTSDLVSGNTGLHYAIIYRRYDIVDFLLAQKADIEKINKQSETPLFFCSTKWGGSDTHMLDKLIANKANVNCKVNGVTPLMIISKGNNSYLVNLIINSGAKINEQDNQGRSAIMTAAFYGRLDNVKIIANHGPDLSLCDERGDSVFDFIKRSAFASETTKKEMLKCIKEALNGKKNIRERYRASGLQVC